VGDYAILRTAIINSSTPQPIAARPTTGGNRDGALPLCRRMTWTGVYDLATRIHYSLVHQGEQAEGDKGDTTECKGFRMTPSFLGRRRRSVAG
jgi:hypothetical protein